MATVSLCMNHVATSRLGMSNPTEEQVDRIIKEPAVPSPQEKFQSEKQGQKVFAMCSLRRVCVMI